MKFSFTSIKSTQILVIMEVSDYGSINSTSMYLPHSGVTFELFE